MSSPTNVPTTDGNYSYTGNLIISGGTVPAGVHATIYVNGNVFISSNISFANSNAYSPNTRQISCRVRNGTCVLERMFSRPPVSIQAMAHKVSRCAC